MRKKHRRASRANTFDLLTASLPLWSIFNSTICSSHRILYRLVDGSSSSWQFCSGRPAVWRIADWSDGGLHRLPVLSHTSLLTDSINA